MSNLGKVLVCSALVSGATWARAREPSPEPPLAAWKLLYYERGSGAAAIGVLNDRSGHTTLTEYKPSSFGAWTHIVGDASEVFFYDMYTGNAAVGEVSREGKFSTKFTLDGFKDGWTHIVRHRDYLFFYNTDTGAATVGRIEKGAFRTYNNGEKPFQAGWTHITSTPSGLFFYDQATGSAVSGEWQYGEAVKGSGEITHVSFRPRFTYPVDSLTKNWTHVVSTAAGLLFYRASDGHHEMADLAESGLLSTRPPTATAFRPGWTHVVACDEQVLFYDSGNGDGVIAALRKVRVKAEDGKPDDKDAGSLILRKSYPGMFTPGYTHIVTTVDPPVAPR